MNGISFNEFFTSIVASLPYFYVGLNNGFATVYIYEEDSNTTMTETEISWIGSSGIMLSFISCLMSSYFMDKFGRKMIFYFIYIIYTVGWMIIAKTEYLLIGRFLISLAVGATYETNIYLVEVLQPRHRGIVLNLSATLNTFGGLFIYFATYYTSIKTICLLFSICAFFLLLCSFLIPDSPYWYVLMNKKNEASKSLIWLRKADKQTIDYEIDEIEKNTNNTKEHTTSFMKTILNLQWLKCFLMFFIYELMFGFIGFDMIIPYTMQFFVKFNRTSISNETGSNVFIGMAVVGSIVTALITEKFNRIPLLKSGYTLIVILLVICGFCENYIRSTVSSFITLISFCIFGSTASIASYGLPWTIIVENLPTNLRATVFSALNTVYCIIFFIAVNFFPTIIENIPIYYVFYSIALFSFLSYICVHYFVNETRGIVLSGN